jgi:leucyl-tRNA synthetase
MILGANGEKMSKSRGNVVNPDDIVNNYGADTLRLYEMFMGPLEASKPWDDNMIEGSKRFLDRIWRLYVEENKIIDQENINLEKIYHQTIKKVTEDYETMNFNTAISQMMIFINAVYKEDIFPKEYAMNFIKILNPIVPHITEEIWNQVFEQNNSITYEQWPSYDESKTISDSYELIVQVNGKVRGKIDVNNEISKEEMESLALNQDNVKKHIEGLEIVKIIVIPNKIVNIVVK